MSEQPRRTSGAHRPLVGITVDLADVSGSLRAVCGVGYADAVARSGGLPLLLPPQPDRIAEHLQLCDAFVLTGGDDPRMEPFGRPTHPQAKVTHPIRQEYESALLRKLEEQAPDRPVLGICLGMQMMALCGGGSLNQHLPDDWPSHELHKKGVHAVAGTPSSREDLAIPSGEVMSNHRQAVTNPGRLCISAVAPDGLIEAVADPRRAFYLGVQWHPERTSDSALGDGLFMRLVSAAASGN